MVHLELHASIVGCKILSLDHAASRNALGDEMIESLCQHLQNLWQDQTLKLLIITGRNNAFSSGGDVKAMQSQSGMFAGDSYQLLWNYQQGIQRISRLMESMPMPVLAVVEGAAVGAGCDLACMADMRIAGPGAVFQESFARLNLVPGDGGTFFLPRVIGYARAMEMMLTAKSLDAQSAKSWGLVSEVYPQAQLQQAVNKTAEQICSLGAPALRLTKLAMKSLWSHNLDRHLEMLAAFQGLAQRMPEHQQLLNQMLAKR